MKIYEKLEQGSPEWLEVRLGKFTASKCKELLSTKTSAGYQNLINEVVAGQLFKVAQESYSNAAMEWGNTYEPKAREQYELDTFDDVREVGFIELNEFVGMSPDGLINEDGLVEIKCPQLTTQVSYLISNKVPAQYMKQIQFQLYVSDRKWCDFFSFYPDGRVKNLLIRVERDEIMIDKIKEALDIAIETAKERISKLKVV